MWGSIVISARPGTAVSNARIVEAYDMTDTGSFSTASQQGLAVVSVLPGSVSVHASGGTSQAPLSATADAYQYGIVADWLAVDAHSDGAMLVELSLGGMTLGSVMLTPGLVIQERHDKIKVVGVAPYLASCSARIMMGQGHCPLHVKAQRIQGQSVPVTLSSAPVAGEDVQNVVGVNATSIIIGSQLNRVLSLMTWTTPNRIAGGHVTCQMSATMSAELLIASSTVTPSVLANTGSTTQLNDVGVVVVGSAMGVAGIVKIDISETLASRVQPALPGSTVALYLRTRGVVGGTWGVASSIAWSVNLSAGAM